MGATEIRLVQTEFPTELLDRFIFAVQGRMKDLCIVEKPLTQEKAMEYLGVKKDSFYLLQRKGVIKPHYLPGLSTPFYFPSEIYETLKKS